MYFVLMRNQYFLLKMLPFLFCFKIGPFPLLQFCTKSLAFKIKLDMDEDDFPSDFEPWNVCCCKIKLTLIMLGVDLVGWLFMLPIWCDCTKFVWTIDKMYFFSFDWWYLIGYRKGDKQLRSLTIYLNWQVEYHRCSNGEIFGATSAFRWAESAPWNRIKESKNLGATAVVPVVPVVTSLNT